MRHAFQQNKTYKAHLQQSYKQPMLLTLINSSKSKELLSCNNKFANSGRPMVIKIMY